MEEKRCGQISGIKNKPGDAEQDFSAQSESPTDIFWYLWPDIKISTNLQPQLVQLDSWLLCFFLMAKWVIPTSVLNTDRDTCMQTAAELKWHNEVSHTVTITHNRLVCGVHTAIFHAYVNICAWLMNLCGVRLQRRRSECSRGVSAVKQKEQEHCTLPGAPSAPAELLISFLHTDVGG